MKDDKFPFNESIKNLKKTVVQGHTIPMCWRIKHINNIENLNLPVSDNDCLIINEVLNLKYNSEFIDGFYNILKNNSKKIIILVDGKKYQVCLDQNKFKC